MFWRKFKLDWSYAIGELIIVTAGVLIALGVNQWQQDRGDLVLELTYADRLKADLQEDIDRFKRIEATFLSAKTNVLKHLPKQMAHKPLLITLYLVQTTSFTRLITHFPEHSLRRSMN